MGLTKYKLGELISVCDDRNSDNIYTLDDVKGISIKKEFIETKADMAGVSLSPYIIVKPDSFAYVTVTSRNGEKITLAHNTSDETYIVSSSYVVFRVSKPKLLLSDYLFMYFNRPEFDRYSRFNSWGSARETFSWDDMCDIDITLPDIDVQRKYVDVYLALQNNLAAYQSKVEDLKLVCDGYIEELRSKLPCEEIGKYIEEIDERNKDNKIKLLQGFCMSGDFIEPRRVSIDPPSLKILKKGEIIYNRAVECVSDRFIVAIREGATCAVSNSYIIFKSKNKDVLLNKYILLWLRRTEFARYSKFKSHGTAHENFEYEDLCEVRIPIPSIEIQKSIVDVLDCYSKRREIYDELKERITNICPILIKGSLQPN